ncbi:MAG: phosphopantetheine-binding protein [Pseudomonadota bacterium]
MTTPDASTFEVLRDVIAMDHGLAPETLDPETLLADLALDSLALIELIFTLEDRFHVVANNVPADLPTLGSVAEYIDGLRTAGGNAETDPAQAG